MAQDYDAVATADPDEGQHGTLRPVEESKPTCTAQATSGFEKFFDTEYGQQKVQVRGELKNCAGIILTYHDVGMNHQTCFRGFFNYAKRSVLQYFAVVHVDAPGHHYGAEDSSAVAFDFMALAQQVEEVRKELGIKKKIILMGAGAGARVLAIYAGLFPGNVSGYIALGGGVSDAGLMEWGSSMMGGLFGGWQMWEDGTRQALLNRWFSQPMPREIGEFFSHHFEQINWMNVKKFIAGYTNRIDLVEWRRLRKLDCNCLCLCGENSSEAKETLKLQRHLPRGRTDYMLLPRGGIILTEERPQDILEPIVLLLQTLGYLEDRLRYQYADDVRDEV